MALTVRSGVSVGGALSHRIVTQAPPVSSTALFTKPAAPRPTRQVRIISTIFFSASMGEKNLTRRILQKTGLLHQKNQRYMSALQTNIVWGRHGIWSQKG